MSLTLLKNHSSFSNYFHKLICDRNLTYKIRRITSLKWKSVYQSGGQDLVRFSFRPAEDDWAKLSLLSHATGFSRCFVFVLLLMIDLGIIKIKNIDKNFVGTPSNKSQPHSPISRIELTCTLKLGEKGTVMRRELKKQT